VRTAVVDLVLAVVTNPQAADGAAVDSPVGLAVLAGACGSIPHAQSKWLL
jgi:hypothetical protein